jgi:hypothetical protein
VLRRWLRYLDKIFDFEARVSTLRDERCGARIPTRSVWMSVFLMFATRLPSFNRLEQELRRTGRWDKVVGGAKPSADTLGYALCRFGLEPLRALLEHHLRIAWRIKAIQRRPGEKFRVIAIDGHELGWSQARCCPQCLVREVTIKGKGQQEGQDRKVTQYYHQVVVAQWIGVTPPGILDLELIRPHEGETLAARRLLDRILSRYAKLVDVISADAIYLEAPFLKKILRAGKHFVVVMKQETRELFQDADQLRRSLLPQVIEEGAKISTVWDIPHLTTFTTLGQAVRVVWAQERDLRHRIIGGDRQEVLEEKTWVWVTDLSADQASTLRIQKWGHDRWDLENRGFNELVQHWEMDHSFIHDPTAIEALLLTLALAFLATYLFFEHNLKPAARRHLTRLALAARWLEDIGSVALQPSG